MKKIKFRVWDTKKEAFVQGGIRINISESPYEIKVSEITELSCADSHVIMQYTGLVDNNGVEIYEGDIVEMSFLGGYVEEVEVESLWDFAQFEWRNVFSMIVLGNIYEVDKND